MTTTRRWIGLAVAAALLAAAAGGVLVRTGSTVAHAAEQCAATCNTAYDQCMKTTNDRYTCDSQRNQCLKACVKQ